MPRLTELLDDLARHGRPVRHVGTPGLDPEIAGISQDTREDLTDRLFVAVRGMHVDAASLVGEAVERGAAAVVVESGSELPEGTPGAVVDNAREALALLAAAFWGHPTEAMTTIGVTGTDGKTTTSILTVEALAGAGRRAGGMTSLDTRCLGVVEPNPTYRTTLEATEIQPVMRRLADAGVDTAVLETTSHGIQLERVAGVAYDVAAFTNLTHEHLDFHGSMEAYRAVKLRLAEMAWNSPRKPGVPKALVFNADEPAWAPLATAPADVRLSYGFGAADLRGAGLRSRIGAVDFVVEVAGAVLPVHVPLTGSFNALNSLCALAICHALGLPLEAAAEGLASAEGLPGRMQVVDRGQPFAVVVDYAHTPDGLAQVLRELRGLTPGGRLLAVFGAPGDRDPSKRPLMGTAVAAAADYFLVSTDDPRHESASDIAAEIEVGVATRGRARGTDYDVVIDRTEAIAAILARAKPGDTVLLAGKGAENRMLVGIKELPWNEVAVAEAALARLGFGG